MLVASVALRPSFCSKTSRTILYTRAALLVFWQLTFDCLSFAFFVAGVDSRGSLDVSWHASSLWPSVPFTLPALLAAFDPLALDTLLETLTAGICLVTVDLKIRLGHIFIIRLVTFSMQLLIHWS
jgi:hypothetical protein